jgi:hypothetical protein
MWEIASTTAKVFDYRAEMGWHIFDSAWTTRRVKASFNVRDIIFRH